MIEPYKFIILFLQFANRQIIKLWQNYNKEKGLYHSTYSLKRSIWVREIRVWFIIFKKEKERRKKGKLGKLFMCHIKLYLQLLGSKWQGVSNFLKEGYTSFVGLSLLKLVTPTFKHMLVTAKKFVKSKTRGGMHAATIYYSLCFMTPPL